MSEQAWEHLVSAEQEYIARRKALFEAGAEAQLRLAIATPQGKGTALRVLIDAPIQLVMDMIEPVFAAAASTHPQVGLARKIVNRVDSGWLSLQLPPLVAELLDRADADYSDFRRVAELLSELGQQALLDDVLRRAQASADEDIREVAEDYQAE